MTKKHITLLGKAIRHAAALRGGGSALPGLVIEKLDPNFLARTLSGLPEGVIVVSGTNGKTTTTKMVVSLLESQGLKVFTNRTGSNFTRGVVAALLGAVDLDGKLDADIAVLELDEAHAVHFVKKVAPRYSLLLNVMRDQLDRFGEIDTTANMLEKIAVATTDAVVLNREDPRVRKIANTLPSTITPHYFGLSTKVREAFPNDDELHNKPKMSTETPEKASVVLEKLDGQTATFDIEGKSITTTLQLSGVYNIFNAAAALALVKVVCKKQLKEKRLFTALEEVTPAFGRGETLTIKGHPLELVLVKNPAGFQLALQSFSPEATATMIAINDNYADGRDMSWLWDVDFTSLKGSGVAMVSGVRAYDMALRLQYDTVEMTHVSTDLKAALTQFLDNHPEKPKRIFCTYTAMLALRHQLSKITEVEHIS
jgi:lipid II isoglutaminyl synthase (glutamine-hydrolysing)